jgi:hypothetical protein
VHTFCDSIGNIIGLPVPLIVPDHEWVCKAKIVEPLSKCFFHERLDDPAMGRLNLVAKSKHDQFIRALPTLKRHSACADQVFPRNQDGTA